MPRTDWGKTSSTERIITARSLITRSQVRSECGRSPHSLRPRENNMRSSIRNGLCFDVRCLVSFFEETKTSPRILSKSLAPRWRPSGPTRIPGEPRESLCLRQSARLQMARLQAPFQNASSSLIASDSSYRYATARIHHSTALRLTAVTQYDAADSGTADRSGAGRSRGAAEHLG